MNTQQLRQSVREKWLHYYAENREWLARLAVWVNCDGQRRPSSGFILATLTVLEPKLPQLLPLIVDLSNNPDRIVMALGLNFNPDEELRSLAQSDKTADDDAVKLLPASQTTALNAKPRNIYAQMDESCEGAKGRDR